MPMPKMFTNQMTQPAEDEVVAVTEPYPAPVEQASPTVEKPVSAGIHGRMLLQVPVTLIDPNPLAPREVYTAEMISARAEDLRDQGQHDPIHVIPNTEKPGRYIICDGWTRVQACLEHKVMDTLLAEVHMQLGLQESAWFGYEQNECRAQHCDLDRAMFYEKLIAAGESAAEIARRAKLSKTIMSFYRAYSRLPEDVLDIIRVHPGKFGATEAYHLSKLCDKGGVRKAVTLAAKYASEAQTQRWLVNQVQAMLEPTEPNPNVKTTGKTIRYANGVYKQHGDSFELAITVPPEHRAVFAEGLEKLLETAAVQDEPLKRGDEAPSDHHTPDAA